MTRSSRLHAIGLAVLLGGVLTAACDSPTEPTGPSTEVVDEYRADGVLFTAQSRAQGGDTLEVTLTVMNETDFDTQTGILGGNCMLRPRVYRERGGELLWSAFDLHDACQEPLRVYQLGGGDEDSDSESFATGLSGGPFFVTLTIDVIGGLVELAAGQVIFR